jgi:methanogenic corrinoid protein MtbC1
MKNNDYTEIDSLPTYNLKAVVLETGLKQDTLRAWERRYGVPNPQRTAGGHRLYSQRDVEVLKWLVARQQDGLSISRAVDLWQRLIKEGRDPLQDPEFISTPATVSHNTMLTMSGNTIEKLRDSWIEACISFDEKTAEQLLAQAAALYSPEVICTEFLQKALAEIGQRWIDGKVSVQQEHFASTLAVRRLEALIAASPSPTRPGRILVVCPPEEQHVFGQLMITFLLRRNGWETLFLGANVPLSNIEDTVQTVKPNLVIMSAQTLYTAATLLQAAEAIGEAKFPVAFGGQIFNTVPNLYNRIPGYFLGEQLDKVPLRVKQILANPRLPADPIPVPARYSETLTHFRERQPLIEAFVWGNINEEHISQVVLAYWNLNLARNIIGALLLGSMSYLSTDLNWAREMIINYQLTLDTLRIYLNTYYRAARENLDEEGQIILDWFAGLAID